uniref:Vacuolar-sorting protein SNF7 n=1 Tax=Lepeophtheirus salmonis TaxID=72036 RepID=D3PH60_LEPSM|nr:Vacuolar-sorting protein SNF7 [Lepeophtheirus salmonis]
MEKELEKYDRMLTQLESQKNTLESSKLDRETLESLRQANEALKKNHKNLNIDDVYKIRDEMDEQQEVAKEISDIISQPIANDLIDEDELMDELNELERGEEEKELEKLLDVDIPDQSVSGEKDRAVKTKTKKEKTEEDELAELEAWMK